MTIRRRYVGALLHGVQIIWPVLSGLLAIIAGIGATIGVIEGWGIWRGIYFGFITALTIGYGDHVPTRASTQLLAVVAGFAGITMTALLAAVAVYAFRASAQPDP